MSPAIGTVRYLDAETAIVDADGRLLLIEQERPSGRQWRLPGGGVEPGESMAEAAVREARGETGLTVRIGRQPIGRFDLCREAWPLDLVEPMLRRIGPSPDGESHGHARRAGEPASSLEAGASWRVDHRCCRTGQDGGC